MYSKSVVWRWGSNPEELLMAERRWNALAVQVDDEVVVEEDVVCREVTAKGFLLSFFKSRISGKTPQPVPRTEAYIDSLPT
jgi:hypothetical protein